MSLHHHGIVSSLLAASMLAMLAGACSGDREESNGGEVVAAAEPGANSEAETGSASEAEVPDHDAGALGPDPEVLRIQLPLLPMTLYLSGVQLMKDNPDDQFEAHQYCAEVDAQLLQCIVFDRQAADARLIGTRYIASPLLYESLPADERAFWHPLNYEVLSGLLAAPQLAEPAELALMERLLNHYGQSWYVRVDGDSSAHAPPRLGWSFSRNGEADPDLLRRYGENTRIDFSARAQRRAALVPKAQPQVGVDALAGHDFGRATQSLSGVVERDAP